MLPVGTPLGRLEVVETFIEFDGPRLFLARNNAGQLFLGMWVDPESEADIWLYLPVSSTKLDYVRAGIVSLRQSLLEPEDGLLWKVRIEHGSGQSQATVLPPDSLSDDWLPAETARLAIPTGVVKLPIEDPRVRATRIMANVVDLAFEPSDTLRNQVPVAALGQALVTAQSLLDAIVGARRGPQSRFTGPTEAARESVRMFAIEAFQSSFGIRMEVRPQQGDLFASDAVGFALEQWTGLIQAGGNMDLVAEALRHLGGLTAARYSAFLSVLAQHGLDTKLTWARPVAGSEPLRVGIARQQASMITAALAQTAPELREQLKVEGTLHGVLLRSRKFEFESAERRRFTGSVQRDFVEEAYRASKRVPASYRATILLEHMVNAATHEVKRKYTLMGLEES